jgi:hypothetical protein
MPKRKQIGDDRPEVSVKISRFEHPNAERIEIVIQGADADARESTATAIIIFVQGLLADANE